VIAILADKKILYVGTTPWADTTEQQFIFEALANSNLLIWINPFGKINDNLLPRITKMTSELTVYYPGMNFLGLPMLKWINEKRRFVQIYLYLIEREFEPDLVWFDDPLASSSADYYRKKGSLSIFFACPEKSSILSKRSINQINDKVDIFITSDKSLYELMRNTGKAYLLTGHENLSEAEKKALTLIDDLDQVTEDVDSEPLDPLLETAYFKMIDNRIKQLAQVINKKRRIT